MESLRAFGYTPATAVADLVDNSIAADATRVDIVFHWEGDLSWVSIADDGRGMSGSQLTTSMRLGSRNPRESRAEGDLGRFGLGLKTASFSQARCLTVMSRPDSGEPSVRQWDLDLVERTNEWRLVNVVPASLHAKLLDLLPGRGTVVVWEGLDRLTDKAHGATATATASNAAFLRVVNDVRTHLELVFHRFLSRPSPVRMTINGQPLVAWDPFLRAKGSSTTGIEVIPLGGTTVSVQPFVLPHKSKLSNAEHDAAAGVDGWNSSQGFYVYRGDRLLVGGSWLGLGGVKEEHSKLARIQLDIPSSLDHLWQVDVRKASIKAPNEIHADLKRIARATKKAAQEVYRFRGKQLMGRVVSDFVIGWTSLVVRGGTQYRLNRRHPLVLEALESGLSSRKDVERLLRFAEETLPVTQIGVALADSLDQARNAFEGVAAEEVTAQLEYLFMRIVSRGGTPRNALDYLGSVEPFIFHPDIMQAFREDKL